MKKVAVLILAAGASSRMKDIKQLLKVNNKTLLEIAIENIESVFTENVYCILGANAEKIKKSTSVKNTEFIFNSNFKSGLSSSIVTGIHHLKKQNTTFSGVLIVLADQPEVNKGYINKLLFNFNKKNTKIIASDYHKSPGVPAIFPVNYFDLLLQLKGDKGAKKFLEQHITNTIILTKKHPFKDLDTQEEYLSYLKSI